MEQTRPQKVVIHTYNMGFGECLLISFIYPRMKRHILIDFGWTSRPTGHNLTPSAIAQDIARRCNGKLHAVVATHRHRDHISGFGITAKGKGAGAIIANLNPDVVIQPWTEDPNLKPNAKGIAVRGRSSVRMANHSHVQSLLHMQDVANSAFDFAKRYAASGARNEMSARLHFLGENNLKNASAVRSLMRMGKVHKYVYFGSNAGLGHVLPGVKTHVLGPPTLTQSNAIAKQRYSDPDEFWNLQARSGQYWSLQAQAGHLISGRNRQLFARQYIQRGAPFSVRWLKAHMQQQQLTTTLSLVRILDDVMNNTSVILLFECAGKFLLFPGDAQIENWECALNDSETKKMLEKIDVYKVGHHGSRNATPKSLWNQLKNLKSRRQRGQPLRALLSTKADVHGERDNQSEVPRSSLVEALEEETILVNTERYATDQLVESVEITFP